MTIFSQPVTDKQIAFVRALQKKLHLPDTLLDNHCAVQYGRVFHKLDRVQCSRLIDEMVAWDQMPAELRRMQGQMDLPGMDGAL